MKIRHLIQTSATLLVCCQAQAQTPVQQAYLKTSPLARGTAAARFGAAVAVDRNLAVVGAPWEYGAGLGVNGIHPTDAAFSGAACIFQRQNGAWTVTTYLKASNTGSNDQFGTAVAISGDTVAVGAPFESSETGGDSFADVNSGQGAGYVFVRDAVSGNWSQQALLKASDGATGDNFGYSVAVDGDFAAIGAPVSSAGSGAVYVFHRNAGVWTQEAKLVPASPDSGDYFGRCVAISGNTVLVGAPYEGGSATTINGTPDNLQYSAGAAYIFLRNATTGAWSQQAYLKAPNAQSGDDFGTSVALNGDVAVVGAAREDSAALGVGGDFNDETAADSGAAYVFRRTAGNWSHAAYLKASNTEAGDRFGAAVAVDGDAILVSANRESGGTTGVGGDPNDNSAFNAGAVYRFSRSSGTWSGTAYLKASNTDGSDSFGAYEDTSAYPTGGGLALSGSTALVGAPFEDSNARGVGGNQSDNSATDAGAAYVFENIKTPVPDIAVEHPAGTEMKSATGALSFGLTLLGGDSIRDLIIRNTATGTLLLPSFTFSGPNGGEFSVALSPLSGVSPGSEGTVRIRFAPTSLGTKTATLAMATNDPSQPVFELSLSGQAVCLDGGGDGSRFRIRQEAYLKASNTQPTYHSLAPRQDEFGFSVAVSGDVMVVGAIGEDSSTTQVWNTGTANPAQEDNGMSGSGAAYVFRRSTTGEWSQEAYLKASNPGFDDQFGRSVAINGDVIVVGAVVEDGGSPGVNGPDNNDAPDCGAAYVFERDPGSGQWRQTAYLKPSNPEVWEWRNGRSPASLWASQFGSVVDVAGTTVVVGFSYEPASLSDPGAPGQGAVYVFRKDGPAGGPGFWQLQERLTAPADLSSVSPSAFGRSVALSGDLLAVGSRSELPPDWPVPGGVPRDRGVITVYRLSEGAWVVDSFIMGGADERRLGEVLDLDDEGLRPTIAARALDFRYLDNCVLIYVRMAPGEWVQQAKFDVPYRSELWGIASGGASFASSLALSGNTLLVGSYDEDGDSVGVNRPTTGFIRRDSGAVAVYERASDIWQLKTVLKASNAEPDDYFGWDVGLDGSLGIVGARQEASGARGVGGDQGDNESAFSGAAYVFSGLRPEAEIAVTKTSTAQDIANNATVDFGSVPAGRSRSIQFTITNQGDKNLSLSPHPIPDITLTGDVGQFSISENPADPVAPGGTTTFTIQFAPSGTGTCNATATIGNSDLDEGTYTIQFTGYAPSPTDDLDGDGIPDADEFDLEPIGFSAGQNDSARASTLTDHAEVFDLYDPGDMQALLVDTPLIFRNPGTGEVTLTLGVHKSTDLLDFDPLPASAPQVTVNPAGKIEFRFPAPDPRAFFRIDAR